MKLRNMLPERKPRFAAAIAVFMVLASLIAPSFGQGAKKAVRRGRSSSTQLNSF
jgi:hypothetical protein